MRCIASLQKQQHRAAIRGWIPKEILTEDEVKCSLLTSPFIEPGNPSLSAYTLIRSVGDSENRRCGVHNESGQSLRRDFNENAYLADPCHFPRHKCASKPGAGTSKP